MMFPKHQNNKMSIRCRVSQLADVPALVALEKRRWKDRLGMTEPEIAARVAAHPEGQFVLEVNSELCGALYTQILDSIEELDDVSFEEVSALKGHSKSGTILQLVSIAVDAGKVPDGGNMLRNYAVSTCMLTMSVKRVVAITRCSSFGGGSMEQYNQHIASLTDPTIYFHSSGGASVVKVIQNYRPNDQANLCCGIFIEYSPVSLKRILSKRLEADIISIISSIRTSHLNIIVKPSTPLLTVLDSLQLLALQHWLEEHIQRKLPVEFLFHYSSAEDIVSALIENHVDLLDNKEYACSGPVTAGDEVAIVGLAMNFPGDVTNLQQLWQLLVNKEKVGKIKRNGQCGNYLSDIFNFDPEFFGLTEAEVECMDPSHRLLLDCTAKAIYDYGRRLADLKGSKTAVYVGMCPSDFAEVVGGVESVHKATGGALSMAAGRISFLLGLHGPSLVVDTACSSSLVALHQALPGLLSHDSNLAIVAGVNLILGSSVSKAYKEAGMLSPDGQCHTFDEAANGYCRAEGCGAVILKRLSDAERDGDHVYAVIKGSAVMHHGRGPSLTAPNVGLQCDLLKQTLLSAGLRPSDICAIEAHGTGTPLGDPVEVAAIASIYGREENLFVTSVKANLGHLEAAAGIAGLFSVIASLESSRIPPNAALNQMNRKIIECSKGSCLKFPDKMVSLEDNASLIRIGLSSFGYSGTISHVILEEYPKEKGRCSAHLPLCNSNEYQPKFCALTGYTSIDSIGLYDRYGDMLKEHVVYHKQILPAAAMLELISHTTKKLNLRDVLVLNSLNCSTSACAIVQSKDGKVTMYTEQEKQVCSLVTSSCLCHYSITLPDFATYTSLSTEDFYLTYKRNGLYFGKSFRLFDRVLVSPDSRTVVGYLSATLLSSNVSFSAQVIDSMIHLCGALLINCEALFVPFHIESFDICDIASLNSLTSGGGGKVFSTLLSCSQQEALFNVALLDESDILVTHIKGLRMREVKEDRSQRGSKYVTHISSDNWLPISLENSDNNVIVDKILLCQISSKSAYGSTVEVEFLGEKFRYYGFENVFHSQRPDARLSDGTMLLLVDYQDVSKENMQQFLERLQNLSTACDRLILILPFMSSHHEVRPYVAAFLSARFEMGDCDMAILYSDQAPMNQSKCSDKFFSAVAAVLKRTSTSIVEYLHVNSFLYEMQLYPALTIPHSESQHCLTLERRGSLDWLHLQEYSEVCAELAPDEVSVDAYALSLNFRDVLNILGLYPGEINAPGCEFAGVVTAVGEQVKSLSVGDRVLGYCVDSLKSRLHCIKALHCCKVPSNLTLEQGSTLPIVYCTAYWALKDIAHLSSCDTVLIHNCAGGVGLVALQLAKRAGARVIGTASAEKRSFLLEQGVDCVINSRDIEEFRICLEQEVRENGKLTVVVSSLSEEFMTFSANCLIDSGIFIELGKRYAHVIEQLRRDRSHVSFHELALDSLAAEDPQRYHQLLTSVCNAVETRLLSEIPLNVYDFYAHYKTAFESLKTGKNIGKVVLRVKQDNSCYLSQKNVGENVGAIIITGGTGGLGIETTRTLIDMAIGKEFYMVSRTARITDQLKQLLDYADQCRVKVEILCYDVSKEESVQALLCEVRSRSMGGCIDGIIHAAGVLRDALIRGGGAAAGCEDVWNAKALSAWWLHKHTQDDDLQFFVCYSSIVSLIGRLGQSAYGSANAFLDSLMCQRRRLGRHGLSVRWPAVREAGMAARLEKDDANSLSCWSITLLEFRKVLSNIFFLQHQAPVLTVYPSSIAHVPEYSNLSAVLKAAELHLNSNEIKERKQALIAASKDFSDVRQTVIEIVLSRVTNKQQVNWDSNLSDYGVDSLGAVDIASNLSKSFSLNLSPVFFFNHPTVNKMVAQIEKLLGIDEIPGNGSEGMTNNELGSEQSDDMICSPEVCIVASACCFPGEIYNLEAFSKALHSQNVFTNRLSESSPRAKQWSLLEKQKSLSVKLKELVNFGAFLSDESLSSFDYKFFKITQAEALQMDVRQKVLLNVSRKAFQTAGLGPDQLEGGRVGVYVACLGTLDNKSSYSSNADSRVTPFDATTNSLSVAAGRISFVFGLQGPCMTIDTACSSSLVALHTARRALEHEECELALVIAVNILDFEQSLKFAAAGMLSPDGQCHTFDEAANGYCRAEGCGAVILKRLSDAERDGDHVYAVIKGSAVMQDGKSASLTAPNGLAQEELLKAALRDAKLQPQDVSYIEAHGTGTKLGDPIEIEAIAAVYGQGRAADHPLYISGAKANFGHLEAAAGMLGLFAVLASFEHHKVAGNAQLKKLNNKIKVANESILFPKVNVNLEGERFYAALSSFGYSGTIAHIILSSHPSHPSHPTGRRKSAKLSAIPNTHPMRSSSLTSFECSSSSSEDENSAQTPSPSTIVNLCQEAICLTFGIDEGDDDQNLTSLGFDSLVAFECAALLSEKTGVDIDPIQIMEGRTMTDIISAVLAQLHNEKRVLSSFYGDWMPVTAKSWFYPASEGKRLNAKGRILVFGDGLIPFSVLKDFCKLLSAIGLEVYIVQLPGHRGRDEEKEMNSLKDNVEHLVQALQNSLWLLKSSGPLVLLGLYSGIVLAFETAWGDIKCYEEYCFLQPGQRDLKALQSNSEKNWGTSLTYFDPILGYIPALKSRILECARLSELLIKDWVTQREALRPGQEALDAPFMLIKGDQDKVLRPGAWIGEVVGNYQQVVVKGGHFLVGQSATQDAAIVEEVNRALLRLQF